MFSNLKKILPQQFRRLHRPLFFAITLLLSTTQAISASQDIVKLREEAVALAREGNAAKSIEQLEGYLKTYPDNIALVSDLIVVSIWNGDHQKAVDLYHRYPASSYPEYVLISLISSYRNDGQSKEALQLLESVPASLIDTPAVQLRKIQLLIDTRQYDTAKSLLEKNLATATDKQDLLKVAGYLYSASNMWINALDSYQQILENSPTDAEALDGRTAALLQLGAPFAASQYIDHSSVKDRLQKVKVLQGKAALLLRWSSHSARTQEESTAYARKAYSHIHEALAIAETLPDSESLRRSLLYDLIVAHTNLKHNRESYALFLTLTENGETVPAYVIRAAAEALLALKQPDDARKLLRSLPDDLPRDYQTDLTLFYALIESEHFNNAYELIDTRLNNTPKFKTYTDSAVQYRNDERLDLEVIAAQARLYGDQLSDAWNRVRLLQDQAPANDWLTHVTGEIALARNWPREAYRRFQAAYALNPDNHNALAGIAQSDIRLHRYKEAQETYATLQEKNPTERSTSQLAKDLQWAEQANLWADLELSYSEGPEQSGDGVNATTEIISSPINHRLHLNLQGRYAWSELLEGEESRTTYGTGLEYRDDNYSLLSVIQYNDSTLDEFGGVLRGQWTPDDHFSFTLQGERFSDATPLRALFYGIREDRLLGSASYRWHEGRLLSFNIGTGHFTDDNDRLESGLNFRERVIDIPRFDLDLALDLYGSSNSREDAPYFNPKSDFSTKAQIIAEHIIYRAYDTSLVQKFSSNLGLYAQENYSTGPTASLGYNLLYNHSPWIETVFGVELGQNRYDGEDEPYYKFTFLIHARF